MNSERQRELGARLRRIRGQQNLSLAQVEERSDGRWKAVVVGAYERGDRAVTIERLAALAAFYDVPITHLLPEAPRAPDPERSEGILLDLTRLAEHDEEADPIGAVARFARRIQLLRGDHAGRVLSLRDADVRTIALAAGMEPQALQDQLRDGGLVGSDL
jgi:transcriptional regulator with XRE-family HTH domain